MTEFDTGIYGHTYVAQGREIKCYISGELSKDGMHWQNIRVMGKATCSHEDTYDEEFGQALARIRAYQYFYKKVEKELIRYSYRNNRKKVIKDDDIFLYASDVLDKIFKSGDDGKMKEIAEYVLKIGGRK